MRRDKLTRPGIMALSSMANLFIGSSMVASAELYMGLFVFSFYVLYDTQVIVERVESAGVTDDVRHALTLYTDFADIFMRLLVILARSSSRDEDHQSNRRRRHRSPGANPFNGRRSFF